jgi:hypothetical protein
MASWATSQVPRPFSPLSSSGLSHCRSFSLPCATTADDDFDPATEAPGVKADAAVSAGTSTACAGELPTAVASDGPGPAAPALSAPLNAAASASPIGAAAGDTVLELGAGVGVLGLAVAASGMARRVAVTDFACLVPLMRRNLRLNSAAIKAAGADVCVEACLCGVVMIVGPMIFMATWKMGKLF